MGARRTYKFSLNLILFVLAWATAGVMAMITTVASEERSLAFDCAMNELDTSISVLTGFNGCDASVYRNYVTVTTSDGEHSEVATSVAGDGNTFNTILDLGCVNRSVNYIQFQLSYQPYWLGPFISCMIVEDSVWTSTTSFSNTLSDGSSTITYSTNIIGPPSSIPSPEPSPLPTQEPTSIPFPQPTQTPTHPPTQEPTSLPSLKPTHIPTFLPTQKPTSLPSLIPSSIPTRPPTQEPTSLPFPQPTLAPTLLPTQVPTSPPSLPPSLAPSLVPSSAPTITCYSGYYYSRETFSCIKCPVGHFSNYSSSYTNFSSCTLCPAGKYSGSTGSGTCDDCAPGKLSQPSRVSCADCSAGEYARDDIDCVFCPTGQYAPQPLTGSCLPCAAGFKTNKKLAATSCSACSAGYICAIASTCALNCSECPKGTFSPSGQSACTACIPGWFAGEPRSASCSKCSSGQFAPNSSSTMCIACPVGRAQASSGETKCNFCSEGYYSSSSGSPSCAKCNSGTFSASVGSAVCDVCPPGKSQSGTGSSFCSDCLKGAYASDNGTVLCTKCLPGTFAPNSSAVSCLLCPVGKDQVSSGQHRCSDCSSGRYASAEGSSSCSSCAAGHFNAITGALSCSQCSAGQFQENTASNACVMCSEGYYAEKAGTVACTLCPTGYDSLQGSTSCDLASLSSYMNPRTGTSDPCPTGAVCSGGNQMPKPIKGYWVDRSSISSAGITYECIRRTCIGSIENAAAESRLLAEANTELIHNSSCWSLENYANNGAYCDPNLLLCRYGSYGPLCGSCIETFIYSTIEDDCQECTSSWIFGTIFITLGGFGLGIFALFHFGYFRLPLYARRWWLVGITEHLDSGTFRVVWSTYQIVQSIAWNLNIKFPSPFSDFLSALSVFSFDFLSIECVSDRANQFVSVLLWSGVPIVLAFFNMVIYAVRRTRTVAIYDGSAQNFDLWKENINQQHMYLFLMLTYLVLPPVSRKQFQMLGCVEVANGIYLRVDTSIDCDAPDYQSFLLLDVVLILIYLSIPLVWLVLLHSNRHRLNPKKSSPQKAICTRNEDPKLRPFAFLFSVYEPRLYLWEVFEMYRRILFVGALPLLSSNRARLAAYGVILGMISAIVYRELEPFSRANTNLLGHVAQHCILLTFGAALAIEVDLLDNLNNFSVGITLVLVNLIVVFLAVGLGAYRHFLDNRRIWMYQGLLTSAQMRIIDAVMMDEDTNDDTIDRTPGYIEMVRAKAKTGRKHTKSRVEELKQHLLAPREVILDQRVGSGAFGEVFRGRCFSQLVAIKTMLHVTEDNVRMFRAEILLTSVLRHPCIVNFIGACWSRELTCMVLEWVQRGPLSSLLDASTATSGALRWDEHLLTLAQDVCRGMVYLHSREYVDESDGSNRSCIMHRDLKPDNVLVTDLMRAKIADFGASKSMSSADAMAATVAGTPLFAAPEIMRGEEYGASCDVYSFGMMLLEMASSDGLLSFLQLRWRTTKLVDGAKSNEFQRTKQAQRDVDERQAMAMMRTIWQGNFRPLVLGGPPVPSAPPSVSNLIMRCTLHDPAARPSFSEVLIVLATDCAQEADALIYIRGAEKAFTGVESTRGSSQEPIAVGKAEPSAARASSKVQAHDNGRASINRASSSNDIAKDSDFENAQGRRNSASQSNLLLQSQVYRSSINPLSRGASVAGGGDTKKFRPSEKESQMSIQVAKAECTNV